MSSVLAGSEWPDVRLSALLTVLSLRFMSVRSDSVPDFSCTQRFSINGCALASYVQLTLIVMGVEALRFFGIAF